MAALLRRIATIAVIAVLALLALSASALASGRDVLGDYQDNGRIDACYGRSEFREALSLAQDNQRVYGNAIDVIRDAMDTNLARPGERCTAAQQAPDRAVDDSDGSGAALWIGLAVAVGVVAVGAGAWARRGGREA
jgi:hypothetical protein